MKQLERVEKKINDVTYYIAPFPAFKAANLSGKLASLVTPMLGAVASMLKGKDNVLDKNVEDVAPLIASAFSGLSGDKIEMLLKDLLLSDNISVEDGHQVVKLTEDIANEIFCGETQDMFLLAAEVIKVNYSGFFTKIANQFGIQKGVLQKAMNLGKSTVNSTLANSMN